MEPVQEQVLRYEQEHVRYGEGGQEQVEDQLAEREAVAGEGKSSQRRADDGDGDGGDGDDQAVEEIVAETVLAPRLGVVVDGGMSGH